MLWLCRPSWKVKVGRIGCTTSADRASSASLPAQTGRQYRLRKFDRRSGAPSALQSTNGKPWLSIISS
ncbi:hypothetical protein AMK34_07410 [Amycolatopsis sp. CB00013]|nr:hypothetical protein AMK34_07410 [Amycolatopsis sp. CB00013]